MSKNAWVSASKVAASSSRSASSFSKTASSSFFASQFCFFWVLSRNKFGHIFPYTGLDPTSIQKAMYLCLDQRWWLPPICPCLLRVVGCF